jgi:hypothetical protein
MAYLILLIISTAVLLIGIWGVKTTLKIRKEKPHGYRYDYTFGLEKYLIFLGIFGIILSILHIAKILK